MAPEMRSPNPSTSNWRSNLYRSDGSKLFSLKRTASKWGRPAFLKYRQPRPSTLSNLSRSVAASDARQQLKDGRIATHGSAEECAGICLELILYRYRLGDDLPELGAS